MNFDCSSFCHENSFLAALLRFNLLKGPHATIESPKESLIESLAGVSSHDDVSEKVSRIIQSDFRYPRQVHVNFNAGKEFEYGIQANLLTDRSCPNVGLLAALSCLLRIEIYVVCGYSPLRFLRIQGNDGEYDVIKFNCFESNLDEDDDSDPPRRFIIGMVGMGIFHPIFQPDENSPTWDLLSRKAIPIDLDFILRNELSSDSENEDNSDQVAADGLIGNEDPNLEPEVAIEAVDNVQPEPGSNISIQRYLDRFCHATMNGIVIDNQAYNNQLRIDLELTSEEDRRNFNLTRLEQVIDVDGFFGVYRWNEKSIFRGNADLFIVPEVASQRDIIGFDKILINSHFHPNNRKIMLKIGICGSNFGNINLFYSCFFNAPVDINDSKIIEITKQAFTKGKLSKCRDDSSGAMIHTGCESHRIRENTDAYRPVESSNRTEPVDNGRYECFAFHFGRAMINDLSGIGVQVTDDFCFVQAVGMKFTMISPTINGVSHAVNEISSYFDLNRMNSYYDICFATVGHTSNTEKSVS